MKNYLKRALALVLAFSMCASMAVVGASAAKYDLTTDNLAADKVNELAVGEWMDLSVSYDDDSKVIGSFAGGGNDETTIAGDDYDFDAALWIDETGVYDEADAADKKWNVSLGDKAEITDNYAKGIVINSTITEGYAGYNGIIIDERDYVLEDITITMNHPAADGTTTCDFSGKGTAIAVYGDVDVTVKDATINCTGVAVMPMFCDDGATVTVMDSKLIANGGTVYKNYVNSPDQSTMVAPPWILGIMGNARTTNLEGNDSTFNFIGVDAYASNWAVLSTDAGSNMYMNMYDTKLELTGKDESIVGVNGAGFGGGAQGTQGNLTVQDNPYTVKYGNGYGTYVIGSAVETFAGATLNVGTYATIFTGGTATFTNIEAGKTYTLKSADGQSDVQWTSNKTAVTKVNSDTFGLMAHQGTNTLVINGGTEFKSGYTMFLVKSGQELTATIDNAVLKTGNNVLIQMMDNDDSTTGMKSFSDGFLREHTETMGFRTADFAANGGKTQNFTFTNGDYVGNIYNATGSSVPANEGQSAQSAEILNLTLGKDATLTGAVAKTATVHVTYDGSKYVKETLKGDAVETKAEADLLCKYYQNAKFTISEYYDIGQVANMIAKDSNAAINVELTDNAVWNVDGTSVINSLTLSGTAHVVIPKDVVLTIDGVDYTDCILYADSDDTDDGASREPITVGSYCTGDKIAAAPRYASVQNKNGQVKIDDNVSWHNGVVIDKVKDGGWNLTGYVSMLTDADGKDTNDFSGLGAAVMVNGNGGSKSTEDLVITYINDMDIETSGVAKLALFTDNGAVSIVDDSALIAWGGEIWDGYMSTADQSIMVSPPWVLGLGGNDEAPCNARTTNLMGDYSVAAYVDSYFYAKGWGALSVDSGSNMHMVTVNSDVVVETSGYGAYNIGNSTEDYYGVRMDVATYAIIMTGGIATFESYTGGEEIIVTQYTAGTEKENGIVVNSGLGWEVARVKSDKVEAGKTIVSQVKSENFGFMMHSNGMDGWNYVTLKEGTQVSTGDAIFLVKKVNAELVVEDAVLDSGNDVLVQIIDNDDDFVGTIANEPVWGFFDGYGHYEASNIAPFDPNYKGELSHFPTFETVFEEQAGYSNEWAAKDYPLAAANVEDYNVKSNWVVNYTMTDTIATGDLWNSTGYVGSNPATTMNVELGKDAVLTGIISAGAFSHTTKYAEVGNGDWTQADALGHVTNVVNSNGVNVVNVELKKDAVWVLTGDAYIDTLKISDTASVIVPEGVTLTVGDTEYTNCIVKKSLEGGEKVEVEKPEKPADPETKPSTPDNFDKNDNVMDPSWEIEKPADPEQPAPEAPAVEKKLYGTVYTSPEGGQGGGMMPGGTGDPGVGGGESDDGYYVVWSQQSVEPKTEKVNGKDVTTYVAGGTAKLAINNTTENGKTAEIMGWTPGYVKVTATLYGAGGLTPTYTDDVVGTYEYIVKVNPVAGAPELYIVGVEYGDAYVATATDGTDDWFNNASASSNVDVIYLSNGIARYAPKAGQVGTLIVKEDGQWIQVDILDYLENMTALTNTVTDQATNNWRIVWTDGTYTSSGFGKFMNMGGQNTQYTFRQALLIADGEIVESESIKLLVDNADVVSDTELKGGKIVSEGAFFNGVTIRDSEYTITGTELYGYGDGADDFNGLGAMVFATGDSVVTLDGVYIETAGVVRTGAAVMGNSDLYIKNSVIYTQESEDTQAEYDALVVPMMKRTPFALGMDGVVRATNVLGAGQGIYSDSIIVSTGWGALSTDSNVDGTEALIVDNVLAGIGEVEVAKTGKAYTATKTINGVKYGFTAAGVGYVAYADAGVIDTFTNVDFYSEDYVQIMASKTSSATYTDSYLYSGRIAVMTQQNKGGTITIKDSVVDVEDTLVQIKAGAANEGYTNVVLDNADVNIFGTNSWSGALVELVESDDAGNPGNVTFTIMDEGDTKSYADAKGVQGTSTALIKNGDYEGNIFNNIYNYYALLDVTLENANLTGTVSSSYGYHEENGERIANGTVLTAANSGDYRVDPLSGDYALIGAQVNVVDPTEVNPVNLTIDAASTWTVGEVNYINKLSVANTDVLAGAGTVYVSLFAIDGELQPEGTYTYGDVTVVCDYNEELAAWLASSSDSGILADTTDYLGNKYQIKVEDQNGAPAARYLDSTYVKGNADGTVSFSVVVLDKYAEAVTLKEIVWGEGIEKLEGSTVENFDYGFKVAAAAEEEVAPAAEEMPGDPGMGGMPGMGDQGGSAAAVPTVTIILNVDESKLPTEGTEVPPVADPEPPVVDPQPPVVDPQPPVVDPEPPFVNPFTDVVEEDWFYEYVMAAAEAGIVNGYADGTFKANNTVTRAEAAKMIAVAMGLEIGAGETAFADVASDAWYAPYVAAAVKAGAMKGLSDTEFDPNGELTRAQAAALMVQAKKLTASGACTFTDVAADAWYADEIAAACEAGIICGYEDNTYKPENDVTRAELAKMIVLSFADEG